ncbi:MAG TPA: vanadium-dependent haloperoxidase [Ferruginibacter sp.]|nr:vanadium-dependent haloperoxidase [Ferruginibacter sp.]HMP19941.1 vanadium-dependent haloperoxidase [Ferruginibacter sp.]
MKKCAIIIISAVCCLACNNPNVTTTEPQPEKILALVNTMSDIMVHDVTNPPLAARFFAYSFLAGYEVISQNDSAFTTMYGVLNKYPQIKKPNIKKCNYQLAALYAIIVTAEKLQPSGKLLNNFKQSLNESCRSAHINQSTIEASVEYGVYVAEQILKYAKEDGYRNISDYPRYTPRPGEGYWFPTPPAFMAAVEPFFNTVRPFMLNAATQFKPVVPVPFNALKNSPFYVLMDDVYHTGKNLNTEQKAIAAFWDCNPFAIQDEGHLKVGIKKISPGAHWMGIAGIACKKAKSSFNKTIQVHAVTALTLMDAFIYCWDEKYHSNRIRPETAIRKYIDHSWIPLLQTPPFPEYPSGHSVISTASAEVLSWFFGQTFSYTDDVEAAYGLTPRTYTSFKTAAAEAAISRFYGGIHFMDAVQQGVQQGKQVGTFVIQKLFKENR